MNVSQISPGTGSIQVPANLGVLKTSLNDFDAVLADVHNILSPISDILNDLLPILELPTDIKKLFQELQEIVAGIEAATAVLIPIPIVGEIVAGVDEALDDFEEILNIAQNEILTPMQEFCTPIAKAINDIEKPIQDIDAAIVSLRSAIIKWGTALDVIQEALALAAGIGNAFDEAGQQSVGSVFQKLVDAYNEVVEEINKPLGIINTAMGDINKVLQPLGDAMSKLKTGTFDKIGNAVANIDHALTTLNPLNEFLSHIQVVLKPFEWVLDEIGKIINKVLGPVLNPLMKPLGEKILGVIGLPPDFTSSIKNALSDNANSSATQGGSANVVTQQNSVAGSQANLETAMSNFVTGDINTICKNLLTIIQQTNSKQKQ